jgi:hypothetical protein
VPTKSEIDCIRERLATNYYEEPEATGALRTLLSALDEAHSLLPGATLRAQIRASAMSAVGAPSSTTAAVRAYVDRVYVASVAYADSEESAEVPW